MSYRVMHKSHTRTVRILIALLALLVASGAALAQVEQAELRIDGMT